MTADGPAAPFRVALTFDAEHPDRPSRPGVQERLLEALDALAVPATFFVQGRWAEAFPGTARRISEAGHLVGNHSHYHARMPHLSDDGLRFDLETAHEIVGSATGIDPRPWFRCPFGAGADDPRVLRAVEAAGYRHVGWTVEAFDWEPDRPVEDLERRIVEGVLARPVDAIALLHTWPFRTELALPGIVARLRDAGAKLVRVDALETIIATPTVPADDAPLTWQA